MTAKNGIDWEAMGFTVYGECPEYKSTLPKSSKAYRDRTKNISHTPAYKIWARLIQIDKGNAKNQTGILCNEWREFENFNKWYEDNYYEIVGEKMELSHKLYRLNNQLMSPDTSCFLPTSINSTLCKLAHAINNGLSVNVNATGKTNGLYEIRLFGKAIAYSDNKEELVEIRNIILSREFSSIAQKYKEKLPKKIFDKLMNYEVETVYGKTE